MSNQNNFTLRPLRIFFAFLIIWIILFEFVLIANGILPKPSSVFDTINDIFAIYHLLPQILYSLGALTFGLIFSYLFVYIFRRLLLSRNFVTDLILAVIKLKHFVPIVLVIAFIIFWFPSSMYTEYIFILIIGFFNISGEVILNNENPDDEYITAAKSLKIQDKIINGEIKFKRILPFLENSILRLHFVLWSVLLVFEFIQNHLGIGSVIFDALKYRDMPTLFVTALIIYILISVGYYILKFLFNRLIHWE